MRSVDEPTLEEYLNGLAILYTRLVEEDVEVKREEMLTKKLENVRIDTSAKELTKDMPKERAERFSKRLMKEL